MVNELQSQEWAYLLDPCFQLVNTNGKPLTNGNIEVFYHGTRTPYYCASDWNGTLHPFKIKIDSLGSNVVLADPNYAYDVYVYNAYGVLQMSRYNVHPGQGGSGGGSTGEGGPAEHWSSDTAGGASTTVTGGTNVYLTLPSSEDQPEFVDHATDTAIFLKEGLYHIDAVVSFKQDEDDLQNIIKDLVVNTGLIGWDAQMTGQKNWTGPESTDDDRHFLELHTVVSVPAETLQTLYFQISSPVDLDSAAIEKLDIIKLEAGGNGIKYTAGYGIQIDGQVISTSGMMPESSAANFVNVETYNTDIQNIYETIAETSAMIPSGVATEQWVVEQGYITSADLPQSVPLVAGEGISIVDSPDSSIISVDSAYGAQTQNWVEEYVTDYTSAFITEDALNGYATQQWVEDKHYITSADIPEIPEDLVTSGELATVSGDIVSQIPSLDGYATQQWVEDQNFITSADIPDIPEDVVTSGELASTSAALESMIPSLDGYATEEWVGEQGYLTSIPEDLVTSGELATVSADILNDIPSYTAGDNISIENNVISVDDTAGLIAGDNVTITASGDNYVISSIGGEIPADVVTSGELATVSGDIMSQMPTQTTVSIDPTLSSGTKIAEFNINGTSGELFAPGGSSGGSEIFIAQFGVTSYQDVLDAYQSGKAVFADDGEGHFYTITWKEEDSDFISFTAPYGGRVGDGEVQINYLYLWPYDVGYGFGGWDRISISTYPVPSPSWDHGYVLTENGGGYLEWLPPAGGGSEVDIIPTLQTGTKIADYVIDGTSGELYAPDGGSTYNGIKPISVQGSDIALMYGETLTCPDPDPIQCEYRNGKDGDYAYFNNSSYEIESTNTCDIVFPNSTTVEGTSGNTLRLRLTDEINSLYINGTVNLVSNGGTAYLDGSTQTFNLRSSLWRPSGRTWADMFDFSQYSLSDIEGDIRIELWEFNGDTPVQHLEMGNNPLLIYTNAVPSYLNVTYPVPSPTYNQGYVLTENGDGTYDWAAAGGSVPEDVVTSGQLATVSGNIMNEIPDTSDMATKTWVGQQGYLTSVPAEYATSGDLVTLSGAIEAEIPNYVAGDNISIVSDTISVSGTAGLIAGENISITASGDNYIISSSASGGEITFPLEVSGATNVYEARDGLTSGYANAGEIYVGYHDDNGGGEPDHDTVKITPYMVEVNGFWGGSYPNITNVTPQGLEILDEEGGAHYVDGTSIDYWNDAAHALNNSAAYWNTAYNAVNDSASYWNSSIFSDQITSAALVNSLPADASAHPNYLYLIPEA